MPLLPADTTCRRRLANATGQHRRRLRRIGGRDNTRRPCRRGRLHRAVPEGHALALRLYKPANPPHALVVYLHGGGFIAGSLDGYDHLCRHYASEAG
ncbi:alpha/beta hydrolase fold domain-containing protein [Micromonospora sp. M12]